MTVAFSIRVYQNNGVRQVLGNYGIEVGEKFGEKDVNAYSKLKKFDVISEYEQLFSFELDPFLKPPEPVEDLEEYKKAVCDYGSECKLYYPMRHDTDSINLFIIPKIKFKLDKQPPFCEIGSN